MTRFLTNDVFWQELTRRVKGAQNVKAAVAYIGNGGADLLPLKQGDTLVVNLGLQAVRQGTTSPKEIQRFIKRGVNVFTRSNLHAKFFICDTALLVGSANVSKNSWTVLDEAASLTTDLSALQRASDFFEKLCTEPVRPEYLKRCLKEYCPPRYTPDNQLRSSRRQKRVVEAKLWFVGGLHYQDLPVAEQTRAKTIEEQAYSKLKKSKGTDVEFIHSVNSLRYFEDIRVGDWMVTCVADSSGNRDVHPPQQVIDRTSYSRGGGKRRYLLVSEVTDNGTAMPLSQFRRLIRPVFPRLDKEQPRTMAIKSNEVADFILGLWTASGQIKAQPKAKAKYGR